MRNYVNVIKVLLIEFDMDLHRLQYASAYKHLYHRYTSNPPSLFMQISILFASLTSFWA